LGDGIQALKAGILEVGDLLVVNKADRPGADELVRDLEQMVLLGETENAVWRPPVARVTATDGEGVPDLAIRTDAHFACLRDSGALYDRHRAMVAAEITGRLRAELERQLAAFVRNSPTFAAAVAESAERRSTPGDAAAALQPLVSLGSQSSGRRS
jgi:LAO/AO transport system kinase